MATQLRSINGANAIIEIENPDSQETTRIGYASEVTCVENFAVQRIDCLGEIESRDIEPLARAVTGSIGLMRMTLNTLDTDDPAGGANRVGLIPNAMEQDLNSSITRKTMDFFNQPFNLLIKDSDEFVNQQNSDDSNSSQKIRYKIIGCRPSQQSLSLSRGAILGVNVSFEAIRLVEADNPDLFGLT